jgi:hypothetical protein
MHEYVLGFEGAELVVDDLPYYFIGGAHVLKGA